MSFRKDIIPPYVKECHCLPHPTAKVNLLTKTGKDYRTVLIEILQIPFFYFSETISADPCPYVSIELTVTVNNLRAGYDLVQGKSFYNIVIGLSVVNRQHSKIDLVKI